MFPRYLIYLLAFALPPYMAFAHGQETVQRAPVPSCNGCAEGLVTLLRGLDQPRGVVDRKTLESVLRTSLVPVPYTYPSGKQDVHYQATLPGPPHMFINWTSDKPGQTIVIVSFDFQPPAATALDLNNCIHPSAMPKLTDAGWKFMGKDDSPAYLAEEYSKAGATLYIAYTNRYQCLKSISIRSATIQ
jgi:hypothetical protein